MDGRVQVQDRVFAVRDGQQVYGRVQSVSGGQVQVTTHKGDSGFTVAEDAVIVSHRYVAAEPPPPPMERVDLLPPRRSAAYRE